MKKRVLLVVGLVLALTAGLAALLSNRYDYVIINGSSMAPTFSSGDIVVLEKTKGFHADEIVVFKMPEAWKGIHLGSDDMKFVKRIKGVPGDTLTWDGEFWAINGENFSWVKTGECKIPPVERILEENQIFVVGDTEDHATLDSREAFCKGAEYLVDASLITAKGNPVKVF